MNMKENFYRYIYKEVLLLAGSQQLVQTAARCIQILLMN
jgi:hypothetical protein